MEPGPSSAAESRHTAVVWTDGSHPEPADLLEALTGRGIDAVLVGDAYMATAEVCRIYRTRGCRAGNGASAAMLALVIVSPERQNSSCAVCEAVARYAGGTRCWMFGPAGAPQLRPIHDGDLALWSGVPAEPTGKGGVSPAGAPPSRSEGGPALGGVAGVGAAKARVRRPQASQGPPVLRLTGSENPEGEPKASERNADLGLAGAAHSADGARPLLTPEELAMLLGDDDAAER
jgi:hypothetical protein